MDDYISREAAKNAAALIALTSAKRKMTCGEVKRIMENIPPADVRPVVYGHWERRVHLSPIVEAFCSICGDPALRAYGHPARTNYCPNCGADMREATA